MHAVNLELVPVSGSCRTIQMKRFNLNQLAIIALIFSASAFAAQPKSGTAPAPAATSAPVQKLVRIATLNGVEANREFQANVQLLQAQRQTAVELNTAMEKERDARKKAELKTQLDALLVKLNENNDKMQKAYGFSLARNYTLEIESSHIYMFVTEEEAAKIEKVQAEEAKKAKTKKGK